MDIEDCKPLNPRKKVSAAELTANPSFDLIVYKNKVLGNKESVTQNVPVICRIQDLQYFVGGIPKSDPNAYIDIAIVDGILPYTYVSRSWKTTASEQNESESNYIDPFPSEGKVDVSIFGWNEHTSQNKIDLTLTEGALPRFTNEFKYIFKDTDQVWGTFGRSKIGCIGTLKPWE